MWGMPMARPLKCVGGERAAKRALARSGGRLEAGGEWPPGLRRPTVQTFREAGSTAAACWQNSIAGIWVPVTFINNLVVLPSLGGRKSIPATANGIRARPVKENRTSLNDNDYVQLQVLGRGHPACRKLVSKPLPSLARIHSQMATQLIAAVSRSTTECQRERD